MERSIKVSTERVKVQGEEMLGMGKLMKIRMQEVKEEVVQMEGCFQANAVGKLTRAFEKAAVEGIRQIGALMAHLEKLQEIAVIYEEAEKENELVTADY